MCEQVKGKSHSFAVQTWKYGRMSLGFRSSVRKSVSPLAQIAQVSQIPDDMLSTLSPLPLLCAWEGLLGISELCKGYRAGGLTSKTKLRQGKPNTLFM